MRIARSRQPPSCGAAKTCVQLAPPSRERKIPVRVAACTPDDLLKTADNKHYANYGCSMQNNVAAQLANPEDLLGPRKQTPIDAANRTAAIDNYQTAPSDRDFEPNIGY